MYQTIAQEHSSWHVSVRVRACASPPDHHICHFRLFSQESIYKLIPDPPLMVQKVSVFVHAVVGELWRRSHCRWRLHSQPPMYRSIHSGLTPPTASTFLTKSNVFCGSIMNLGGSTDRTLRRHATDARATPAPRGFPASCILPFSDRAVVGADVSSAALHQLLAHSGPSPAKTVPVAQAAAQGAHALRFPMPTSPVPSAA